MTTLHRKASKLIYNPFAGEKRKKVGSSHQVSIEMIVAMLEQYQIAVDLFPTQAPLHATELARDAVKEGYQKVIIVGGDGTVSEAAQGLIGTDLVLGIIPLGTYMNTAHMLGIPREDLEKATMLLKLGRVRKIDVGAITCLNGEQLTQPKYFLESSAIGLEAQFHHHFIRLEKSGLRHLFTLIGTFFDYYGYKVELEIDDQVVKHRAISINVSNGPYSGAALKLSPAAKLNDHQLTVTVYKMNVWTFVWHIIKLLTFAQVDHRKLLTYQGSRVSIKTVHPRLFHADATTFGNTPVTISVLPQALNVIAGYPPVTESAFKERTYLTP